MDGVYTVVLENTITHTDGSWVTSMTFDVTILDPCESTTINPIDLGTGINVVLGETATLTFSDATDSVEVSKDIDTLCGNRSYKVTPPGSGAQITWITIDDNGDGTYLITASPTDETIVGSHHSYELFTTLDNYFSIQEHLGFR